MINLYTNSTIGSYTTGTVTCTKNSATVTGTGTTWSEIVNPGDILTLNDDKLYVIKTVNSNTSITLDKVFAESTVSNSAYRIFLNTAAHFPSDTAAKVERALEQLSDINEAAINNDRTVTAATKVNGKGLTSTTGNIDLNPPTVNSNTGGAINFHYNQSANTTSSIVENASGQIRVNGNLQLNGIITNGIRNTYSPMMLQPNASLVRGTAPSSNIVGELYTLCTSEAFDYNHCLGLVGTTINASNVVTTRLRALRNLDNNSRASGDITINVNDNGDVYTSAPTPKTTDNSTKIATTAFVNNRLPYSTGTWTPILKGSTTAGTFTYESHVGRYLKIGRFVYILGFINISDYGTYPVGGVFIDGIPFVATNSIYSFGITVRGYAGGVDSSVLKLNTGYINKNSTIIICMSQNKTYPQNVQNASWSSSTTAGYEIMLDSTHKTIQIYLSGCYMTD